VSLSVFCISVPSTISSGAGWVNHLHLYLYLFPRPHPSPSCWPSDKTSNGEFTPGSLTLELQYQMSYQYCYSVHFMHDAFMHHLVGLFFVNDYHVYSLSQSCLQLYSVRYIQSTWQCHILHTCGLLWPSG
jgi:hypothetical protein